MPDPRRLLVVIDEMGLGGSQRQVMNLLNSLDRQRWEPELAYFRGDSFMSETIRRSGIPVHYLPKKLKIDPRVLFALARLLRRGNYALVHAFSLNAELWTVLARPLSGRRPLLITSERSCFRRDRAAWYWRFKRFVIGHSVAVIANSRAGAQSTARLTGAPEAMFSTVANGVELPAPITPDERAAIRRDLGAPEGRRLGLFVGRLVEVKNLPCLIRALAMLEPGQRPWIALAGDGPLRASTAQLAASCAVAADLRLLGGRTDVMRLMQAADFLVLPSHCEGLANVVLEAMAAGCPVIASAVGGTPELIEDGQTGLLFPSDDAGALAAAMVRLTTDPELGSRLARASRQYVEQHYSQTALAAETAAVYERCLGVGATFGAAAGVLGPVRPQGPGTA